MPTKDEWVGKLRNHPWKKIMVRLLWDMREDTSALDGGFVMYEVHNPRTGERWHTWELWTSPLEDGTYDVYRWNVDQDEVKAMGADSYEMSSDLGLNPHHLEELAYSSEPRMQGLLYAYFVTAFGPEEFDASPANMTQEELETRWPELDWRRR